MMPASTKTYPDGSSVIGRVNPFNYDGGDIDGNNAWEGPPDESVQCRRCKRDQRPTFRNVEELWAHKNEQMLALNGHWHCTYCWIDFEHPMSLKNHLRQCHPMDQQLECPNCEFVYNSATAMLQHIYDRQCPGISASRINSERLKMLDFTEKLAALAIEDPSTSTEEGRPVQEKPWRPFVGATVHNPVFFKKSHFASSAYYSRDDGGEELIFEDLTGNGSPKALGALANDPNAKTIVVEAISARQKIQGEPTDPNHDRFRCNIHWVPALRRYLCPHQHCTKAFKNPVGFQNHLRETHGLDKKLTCPSCHREFRSDVALFRHSETAQRCFVAKMSNYGVFVSQLTGGLIHYAGTNPDNTPKFEITPEAVVRYGSDKNARKAAAVIERNKREAAEKAAEWW